MVSMKVCSGINKLRSLSVVVVATLLVGCAESDLSGLEVQMKEIMARPADRIAPLPEIQPYRPHTYGAARQDKRDPYSVFFAPAPSSDDAVTVDVDDGLTPEMVRVIRDRNPEELEQYDLVSLQMLGSMENEEALWGIVSGGDGLVHRVAVGNYIGRNFGKITEIEEGRIILREIVKNTDGRWEERPAQLVILD